MIEKEEGCCIFHIFESRNDFIPFGEVVNKHNDVLVSIARWGVACHEVNAPFLEWSDCNDWV
jgi:hypothetical protein